jgi:hypothetical protein
VLADLSHHSSSLPMPVDHSRVILQGRDSNIPGSDYINANYVKVGMSHVGAGAGPWKLPASWGPLGPETLGQSQRWHLHGGGEGDEAHP